MASEVRGVDVVVNGLENFGLEVREAAFYAVIEALQKAFTACQTVISEGDHTLRQLAELGHPYSAAHGFAIHDPDILVHVQSGRYRSALKVTSPRGSGGDIIDGKIDMSGDPEMQRLDGFIQDGTTSMRARPWMQYIIEHYGNDFADVIEARITAAIQSKAA